VIFVELSQENLEMATLVTDSSQIRLYSQMQLLISVLSEYVTVVSSVHMWGQDLCVRVKSELDSQGFSELSLKNFGINWGNQNYAGADHPYQMYLVRL
jgi:hypothetical protein